MMEVSVTNVPFKQVQKFTQIDTDYTTDPAAFSEFISLVPTISNFSKALSNRGLYKAEREVLLEVLKDQYAAAGFDHSRCKGLLDGAHFTVATAHQPSLLTGPLYFIYKICSTINLARQISEAYPSYHIHPVFIVGGEDHDFAEVNHLHLFGNTFSWTTSQSGPVGRMKVDKRLLSTLAEVEERFGKADFADQLTSIMRNVFREGESYGACMQKFVMQLFEDTPLIVLNMDDARLKSKFTRVVKDELMHRTSRRFIEQSQKALSDRGYKPQTYQRDINLFYLKDGLRARIVESDRHYEVVDTDLRFTMDEILTEVDSHPERFSPNVNLRPLYQEIILPNLAYVGGGGELAYWLERKLLFDHYNVPLPILVRRNSVLYLDALTVKQRNKLDLPLNIIFEPADAWISHWIHAHAEHEISIDEEYKDIEALLGRIVKKADSIDPTLGKKVEADMTRMLKDVDHLGKRLVRAEKAQNETRIAQITKLNEKLFPEGGLQERFDNFIPQYLRHGKQYLSMLINQLDPFVKQMLVIEEVASGGE